MISRTVHSMHRSAAAITKVARRRVHSMHRSSSPDRIQLRLMGPAWTAAPEQYFPHQDDQDGLRTRFCVSLQQKAFT